MVLVVFLAAACSGSSGSRNDRSMDGPGTRPDGTAGPPGLVFSASPEPLVAGASAELSWSSANARACEASGGWQGPVARSGTAEIGPISRSTNFRLSCFGAGGGVSRQVTVEVEPVGEPTVILKADRVHVGAKETARLTWRAENASSCRASGAWKGKRPLAGHFTTRKLKASRSFTLSCEGPEGTAMASVTIEVVDNVLRWHAPTENVDGSPLTDLSGYVIYWGRDSRSYHSRQVIDDSRVTQWRAVIPPGVYFFALTALDAEGNESGYSNEIEKLIP